MSSARLSRSPASNAGGGITRPSVTQGIKVPVIEEDLIRHLQSTFRPSVAKNKSIRDYDVEAGWMEVIAHLESLCAEQTTKV